MDNNVILVASIIALVAFLVYKNSKKTENCCGMA